ncbi:MAG: hypothetical protein ACTSXO_11325 [Candidatus Heimdallarchaeota archaeon]|nr:MAG: hypothetical protein DRP02_06720 [Candidatus Gerdarchaeota archaeon]
MGIVGAFIVPHGAMILDRERARQQKAEKLHDAMLETKKAIQNLRPEIIFLTSPHGISLSNDFAIYLNEKASCSAEWNGEYEEFVCQVEIETNYTEQLLGYLLEKETAISGLAAYTPSVEIKLRWGESVPLWFLKDIPAKYILMSQPLKRLENAVDMIPETLTLGNDLRLFFNKLDERVVIIISADLSHTHQKDGPYGFSEQAKITDKLLGQWAETLNEKLLTKKVASLLPEAKVCGFIGFVLIQGLMNRLTAYKPHLLLNEAPSYYGMMVVHYLKD